MVEREVIVTSDAGIHARPAMMMVKEAMKFKCSVKLIRDEVEADCKSIMSVLGLAIVSGTKLKVVADGEGEDEITNILISMIENNFS